MPRPTTANLPDPRSTPLAGDGRLRILTRAGWTDLFAIFD
jgi:hypothetical protein